MFIKVGLQCWVRAEDIKLVSVNPEYEGWKVRIKIAGVEKVEDIGLYPSEEEARTDASNIVDELNKISERTA